MKVSSILVVGCGVKHFFENFDAKKNISLVNINKLILKEKIGEFQKVKTKKN